MNKTALLTAASVIALCAGSASAVRTQTIPKSAKVLWNQNSNSNGESINSQNYTTGYTAYSDQAADDFVIPKGKTWKVSEVDVSGTTSKGGTPTSETITFYKNKHGMPGVPVRNGTFTVTGTFSSGDIAIVLPKILKLRAGTYWVSVAVNMDGVDNGVWDWEVNGAQHGNQAMWQNPGGGFARCYTWDTIENCGNVGPDLMYELKSTPKRY